MAHYAKIENGKVVAVIVAEQDYINTIAGVWVQTSYNTHGGVHSQGRVPLRKNYAGIGYDYDEQQDAFIPPQPFSSWTLNTGTCQWQAPVPMPQGEPYIWDEVTLSWKKMFPND